ncbi:MAG: M50 family metallopeptidase, partial [Candidatus Moraniibacteriota bacterium]
MLHILSILLIFFALLALLVLTHELGHFLMCRVLGVVVEEFGFGLPPRLLGIVKLRDKKKRKFWKLIYKYSKIQYDDKKPISPIYSLNAIPFGGFVKILGEDGEAKTHPRSFAAQTVGKRFLILIAGIVMNVLLGIFLFTIGYWSGFPEIIDDSVNIKDAKVQVLNVGSGSPAEAAGLKVGDSIRAIITPDKDRVPLDKVITLQTVTKDWAGQSIVLEVIRGNDVYRFSVIPRQNPPEGQGALGIYPARIGIVSYPILTALKISALESFQLIWIMADYLKTIIGQFFQAQKVSLDLSGPVGIVVLTNQFREMGFPYLLKFAGLISLNLAFINFIPYPALDGGRILFLLIEKIKGRP